MNLPNAISVGRITVCPLIFYLTLAPGTTSRYAAFFLFLAAAFSDIWDGHLARKYGWITDMGKLLDPAADKLLLASTFVPIYIVTRRPDELSALPWWGTMPLWVMVVVLGRELCVTLFRGYAARRGIVIPAARSGKYKTLVQYSFVGGSLFWFPILVSATERGWSGGLWNLWRPFHSGLVGTTLALAVGLTVFSMADYLWRYRALVTGGA